MWPQEERRGCRHDRGHVCSQRLAGPSGVTLAGAQGPGDKPAFMKICTTPPLASWSPVPTHLLALTPRALLVLPLESSLTLNLTSPGLMRIAFLSAAGGMNGPRQAPRRMRDFRSFIVGHSTNSTRWTYGLVTGSWSEPLG